MKLQRIITTLVLTIFVFGHVLGLPAYAEAPTPPPAPSAPTPPPVSTPPPAPEAPKPPSSDPTPEPSKTPEPTSTPKPSTTSTPTPAPSVSPSPSASAASTSQTQSSPTPTPTPLPSGNQTGSQTQNGTVGGTTINTGDATNTAGLVTSGNGNTSVAPSISSGVNNTGPSVGVLNTDNGSNSTNSGAVSSASTSTTDQNNSAQVSNNLSQTTITGQNSASDNTGGDVVITSGDALTTGTVINSLNTNLSGVSVAEFNVDENQRGDLVLDFAAGCISGCGTGDVKVANTGNGTDSTNTASADVNNTNNTSQFNEADIANNMTLVADTGNNIASDNTNGDSSINTGDANVVANVLTFANNNIAGGNVVYTVVNVAEDLIGNIVMSKEYIEAAGGCFECGGGDVLAANTGNGTGSTNTSDVAQNNTNNTFQTNDANIENNLIIDATTSNNQVSDNTNGNNSIQTGDANVDAQVLNVANSNVAGGVWWLVLVNEAGNWVGKIVGSPDGTNMAGSSGTEFTVDENGDVVATNSGNGSGSTNTADASVSNTNNTTQDNKINLVNNVNLTANTGGNKASDNTGGASQIQTGDANVVANIVNFVNNNIVGEGKLFVTIVNILPGKQWIGNFITPDATQEEIAEANAKNNIPQVAQGEPEEEKLIEEETAVNENNDQSQDNVTSTTKKTTKKSKKTVIAAHEEDETLSPSSNSGGVFIGTATNVVSQVAGVKIGPNLEIPDGAVVGSNKIRINLAWLVLVLPLFVLVALSRLRIAYYTRKIKNKLASQKIEGVMLGSLIAALIYLLNRVS